MSPWIARLLALAFALNCAPASAQASEIPFTLIARVMEAGPRVSAISIDFGRDLPINWSLERRFEVQAELQPVKSRAGDLIANSASPRAPRTVLRGYTSAKPEPGSPAQGRYVILELDPNDANGAFWYLGFSPVPGKRQTLPYGDALSYQVRLLHGMNAFVPNAAPAKPGGAVDTIAADTSFKLAGSRFLTVDRFTQGLFEMPGNQNLRFVGYNLFKPADVAAGAKVPLVVFLHGYGQSHDVGSFPNAPSADVMSPLIANQGGVGWVELGREKAFVLVPQDPDADRQDAAREGGWRQADAQQLILGLGDKTIAENPSIDIDRLYLTGLSLGAMGSWKLLTNPDPAIANKFAAAVLIAGSPVNVFALSDDPSESAAQRPARIRKDIKAMDFARARVPLWLQNTDNDPAVDKLGSRTAFAKLTGRAQIEGEETLVAKPGALVSDGLVREYRASNRNGGAEVRYTEHQFGNGDRFRDLGMVTRNGHFNWEITYKDRAVIDWMFAQRRKNR